MKLVFITRKVDRGDPLTGFIFSWINKLASELGHLYVICQEKGDVSGLPENVEVHSFGKERGYGPLRQGYQLLVISFKLARRADGFFLHMHPVYAIIVWLPAKLTGRKIILWYTHKAVDWKLRIAHALVDEVLTASAESFRLPSKKVKVVGHGIDIEKFRPLPNPPHKGEGREKRNVSSPLSGGGKVGGRFRIVSIGRISPVKDYETLIKAADILQESGVRDFEIEIYGKIGLLEHQGYYDSLIEFINNANLEEIVKFQGELDYNYVDETYNEADLFVNLSQTGSIDKAVLEAAACETLVITSNEAFEKTLKAISGLLFFRRDHPEELAEKIKALQALSAEERIKIGHELRKMVMKDHDLKNLAGKIVAEFK